MRPSLVKRDSQSTAGFKLGSSGIVATLLRTSKGSVLSQSGPLQVAILVELAQKLTDPSLETAATSRATREQILGQYDFLFAATANHVYREAVPGFEGR
jgi:hypothetical protein